ncbi:MAG: hypothetical protein GYA18_09235 [Chloroflexi bacterium]|nr:hypothetical protein [Chloroflexota bacterium]
MTGRTKRYSFIEDVQFVGGEFYADEDWSISTSTLQTGDMYFLNGGKTCLTVIADFLIAHGIKNVLLPAYLCPSILITLESRGIHCDFYRVQPDLSIDLTDLHQKQTAEQAVYFINYFGFAQSPAVLRALLELQQQGVMVIEDNAQAGFPAHTIGDFVFNSLRKLCPQDGGYLRTRFDMQPFIELYRGLPNRRLPIIRAYRRKLRAYLLEGEGDFDELQRLFQHAEELYANELVVEGDVQERQSIEHLDWDAIRLQRRANYDYLLQAIADIPQVVPIFPKLQAETMPMGLPVYLQGVSRDRVNEELGNASIGLVIHWEELLHNLRTAANAETVEMASDMLTLVCDQRTSHNQLDYLVRELKKAVRAAS